MSFLRVIQIVAAISLVLLFAMTEIIDWVGRFETIETHWPRLWKIINNRPARLIAYILMIVFLAGDIQARTNEPQVPALALTFSAPPPPIIKEERPISPKSAGTTTVVHGSVTQSTNAPCTANNLSGKVDLTGCNPPANPYVPVFTYDLDGTKHGTTGRENTLDQSLVLVFQKFQQLQKEGNWIETLSLSEATKKTDPGWFSLDYISGVARLQLCQASEATRDLKKFYSETTDIPTFASWRADVARRLNVPSTYAYQHRCSGHTQ